MKTLICQLWKTSAVNEEGRRYTENNLHSLHLNEQHRLRFLNKNIKNYRGNGTHPNYDVDVKEHYKCNVEDDVYEQVIKHQTKHGLMFENSPFPTRKSNFKHHSMVEFIKGFENLKIMMDEAESESKSKSDDMVVRITNPKEGEYIVFDSLRSIPRYKRRAKIYSDELPSLNDTDKSN